MPYRFEKNLKKSFFSKKSDYWPWTAYTSYHTSKNLKKSERKNMNGFKKKYILLSPYQMKI